MLSRYFDLLEFIDQNDETLIDFIPSPSENKNVKILREALLCIESVSLALQTGNVKMWEVRAQFDAILVKKPDLRRYMGATGSIVANPDFEAACV
ncbi:Hypothetical protein PHPALM_5904 [Phytophthora palmivora]|uniref:Uncharacterized protein n=1 Tax=Phytophthora palmivora TaxID=4796 RepID=A0A2P4YGA4_9STRA|nr:Hypothetical protein PHPALM_5904 [Phytophthora palmivora]